MLVYLISTFCGVSICVLLLAFIFHPDFRRDCLAKEGDVEILHFFSVHGAVVLCLFGVFLFGLLFPLRLLPEVVENRELRTNNEKLSSANDILEKQLQTSKWTVTISYLPPKDAPDTFDLRTGIVSVAPASFAPRQWDCSGVGGACVYTMHVETTAGKRFEDGITTITYNNGTYYAYISPENEHTGQNINAGDNVRHYGQVELVDLSKKQIMNPEIIGQQDATQ